MILSVRLIAGFWAFEAPQFIIYPSATGTCGPESPPLAGNAHELPEAGAFGPRRIETSVRKPQGTAPRARTSADFSSHLVDEAGPSDAGMISLSYEHAENINPHWGAQIDNRGPGDDPAPEQRYSAVTTEAWPWREESGDCFPLGRVVTDCGLAASSPLRPSPPRFASPSSAR